MSTQIELIRARVQQFFREWLGYFKRMLRDAQAQGMVSAGLDPALTAQALLAYFEGVILLANGRNGPAMISRLPAGALALVQLETARAGQAALRRAVRAHGRVC